MNEKILINSINNLRKSPSNFNNFLKIPIDKNLTQKNIFLNEKNIKNVLEIIKEQQPQKPFKIKEELNKIAKDYLLKIIKNQEDIDSFDLEEIVRSYGNFNEFLIKFLKI